MNASASSSSPDAPLHRKTAAPARSRQPDPASAVVLIVDDYRDNLQVLARNLEAAGFEVALAANGDEALTTAENLLPDLILLDIIMPGLDGLEVCRKLKTSPATQDIPVIFLTAKAGDEEIVAGFDAGAVDYLTKPFNPAELLARVRTHVALRQTRAALERANADKTRFFSIIAHDLKSPLYGITGLLDATLEGIEEATREQVQEDLGVINEAAGNLLVLLNNLLNWSRLQNGTMPFQPVALNLGEVVNGIISLYTGRAREKNLRLSASVAEGTTLEADADMLQTILRNLVGNALKYTRDGGQVTVRASAAGGQVELVVADEGIGISPTNLEKLFSLHTSFTTQGTRMEEGTGLGLLLVRDLVHRHGGTITVESAVGLGTTVIVTLPEKPVAASNGKAPA